jgi:HEAT repeat protein
MVACGGCASTKAGPGGQGGHGGQAAGSKAQARGAGHSLTGSPPDRAVVVESRESALRELEKLAKHQDPQIRANVQEAVRLAPKRMARLVRNGLRDPNVGVRTSALMAVGWAGLQEYAGDAEAALGDGSTYVKASAIFALVKLGRPVDQTPLGAILLGDPSPRVRAHTAFILGELGNRSAVGLLREAAGTRVAMAGASEITSMRLQIAEAMVKLGESEQVDSIRAALYPSTPEELEGAALAAQILGQIGDRGSESILKNLAYQKDQNGSLMPAEVRLATAASLIQIGVPEAVNIAGECEAVPGAAVRAQRAYVLSQSGWAGPFEKLRGLMGDPESLVRVYSATGILRVADRTVTASAAE